MLGISVGEATAVPIVHLSNGVKYKNASIGVGVGYDPYALRKVPLYLDLRYTLLKSRVEPILFSHIGTSFLLTGDNNYFSYWSQQQHKKYAGFYNETGIMLKTKLKGNLDYLMAVSYCYAANSYLLYGQEYWGGNVHYVTEDILYKFNSRRINFKIGFQF